MSSKQLFVSCAVWLLFILLHFSNEAAAFQPVRPLPPVVNPTIAVDPTSVGSVIRTANRNAGSCFCIDDSGIYATSFSILEKASEAYVVLGDGQRTKIEGFLAADRGKDIVLFKLVKAPKAEPIQFREIKISQGPVPVAGDVLVPFAGPSAPRSTSLNPPVLLRQMRGDEYRLGLARTSLNRIGSSPNTEWLWLDQSRPVDYVGGPVFNRAKEVVGMLTFSLIPTQDAHTIIDIKHVMALKERLKEKSKPLSSLKEWKDDLADPNVVLVSDGRSLKSSSLNERYQLLKSIAQVNGEHQSQVDRNTNQDKSQLGDILVQMQKIQDEIDDVVPDEAYRSRETERIVEPREVTRTLFSATGQRQETTVVEMETREVNVTRIRYRFSAQQLQAMAILRTKLQELEIDRRGLQFKVEFYDSFYRRFLKNSEGQILNEAFYLSDPFGLRSSEEHREIRDELTKFIDEGSAPGIVYLNRAILNIQLDELQSLEADLFEAKDANPELKGLVQAINIWLAIVKDPDANELKSLKTIVRENKSDPRVLMIASRIAIESKKPTDSLKYLNNALDANGDEFEIKNAILWLKLSQQTTKKIVAAAEEMVRLSAGEDWRAYLGLSLAHTLSKNEKAALDALEKARKIAPKSAYDIIDVWRDDHKDWGLVIPKPLVR